MSIATLEPAFTDPVHATAPAGQFVPQYQAALTPFNGAAKAKRLQAILVTVSQAAHALARAKATGLLSIGQAAVDYIRLRLEDEADPGIIRTGRKQAIKRLQNELHDALGGRDAPKVEECLRLHGVASVYGPDAAEKLGIGQLRYFEPTIKRLSGKEAKPETWDFKPTLEAGQCDALKLLFGQLGSGEKICTALEVKLEIGRILGKEAVAGTRAASANDQKPAFIQPSGPAEDATRITALLRAPCAAATCRLVGQSAKWTNEMVRGLVAGLADAGQYQALSTLIKAGIEIKTALAQQEHVRQSGQSA